ncbi:hypothetical protein M3Y98_00006100 [Aphelenchoides besseyi]|nr:hypothetical protein M3Y98_00006100 [Aphelenchoides besseyi]
MLYLTIFGTHLRLPRSEFLPIFTTQAKQQSDTNANTKAAQHRTRTKQKNTDFSGRSHFCNEFYGGTDETNTRSGAKSMSPRRLVIVGIIGRILENYLDTPRNRRNRYLGCHLRISTHLYDSDEPAKRYECQHEGCSASMRFTDEQLQQMRKLMTEVCRPEKDNMKEHKEMIGSYNPTNQTNPLLQFWTVIIVSGFVSYLVATYVINRRNPHARCGLLFESLVV